MKRPLSEFEISDLEYQRRKRQASREELSEEILMVLALAAILFTLGLALIGLNDVFHINPLNYLNDY